MTQNFDKHQHKIAAESARPFPASGEALAELIRLMADQHQPADNNPQRKTARFETAERQIVVTVWHPGGSLTAGKCVMLDISAGGAGFLYAGFVHRDSQCVVHVDDEEGNRSQIPALVMWCRFLSRSVHAIGVRWIEPIDVRQFVPKRDWLEQMANSDQFVNAELTGRMLAVGFDEMEIELMRSYLHDTSVQIETVSDSGAARDLLAKEGFDFVMIDSDNGDATPEALLSYICTEGAQEPVIMVTNRTDGLSGTESAGPSTVVPRPYSADVVVGAIRDLMIGHSNPLTGTRPIVCELPVAKQNAVPQYIEKLNASADNIEEYITADAVEESVRLAQTIRNTASGFGFLILEQAADEAVKAINASGSAAESSGALRILGRVIRRLSVGESQAA